MSIVEFAVFGGLLCVLTFHHTAEACDLNTTALQGTIQSPNYPGNYSVNQTCVYIITAPAGYQITLTFTDLDIEPQNDCRFDFVELRDGGSAKSPHIGRLCNTSLPRPRRTFGNVLWIKFFSDETFTGKGFRATFVSEFLQAPFFLMTSSLPGSALGGDIHRMDVQTRSNIIVPIAVTLFRPIAISYDPRDQTIYWTEVGAVRGIRSAALDGSGVRSLLYSGTNSALYGLAVDPLSRLVFYTDAGRSQIGMVTIATKAHRTVVSTRLDKPQAIVLHTAHGVMFWTDWGKEKKIERANYDGSDRKTIVNTGLLFPNGLALEVANNRLYWVDAGTNKIETSDLLGNGRRPLLSLKINSVHHFFGLARLDGTLYFTDWLTGPATNVSYIYGLTIGSDTANRHGVTAGRRLNDIHVVQPKLHNNNSVNGCGKNNGGCDVICIPLPSNSSKCACPDGKSLGGDQRSCVDNGTQQATQERLNVVAIAVGCSGAVVAIIILIVVIVVIVRRRPELIYDRPGKVQASPSVYSVMGPNDRFSGPPAPPYRANVVYEGGRCSINSDYDTLDAVAEAVAANDYLTPLPSNPEKPVPCSVRTLKPEDNYLHPV